MASAAPDEGSVSVIYIAGSGRSGSTLLERLLGRVDGFCPMGEICLIWRQGFRGNRLCGCGKPFLSCEFWNQVTGAAFGADFEAESTARLARSVDKWWATPSHFVSLGRKDFHDRVKLYRDRLYRLYEGARRATGAGFLLDSSKLSGHGLILASDKRIRLHVVHLVRDPRAVAYSWQRRVPQLEAWKQRELMQRHRPMRTAFAWNLRNVTAQALKPRAASYTRIRYEDFVAEPASEVQRILAAVGQGSACLCFISEDGVDLGPAHIMCGNPSKFTYGRVRISLDDEWRDAMAPRDRALVRALTWPLARMYGY